MDKNFDFKKRENEIYKNWEENGYFKPVIDKDKKPFVISMPPPNVTAKLHIGHALDDTIQDILIRYHRMLGDPTLYVPGTDHASIATEVKVVEKLKKEGKSKESLGREKFLEEAWKWKEEYGGKIVEQQRKLGLSCDWQRARFTMDEGCSKAVLEVFERLYNEGIIYKGERLVNWCPECKTPISDIEVEYEEQKSNLWHIRYKIENSDDYVVVATTRPETMLGDTAVAVNPNDDRYKDIVGKRVFLPIVNKYIPVVADRYVDMEFGTGVVKITPAHDPNDFKVGKRHDLEIINILNEDGTLNEKAGKYEGMTTLEAREEIVKELKDIGALVKIEPHVHNVGSCYRCHHTIEPYISNQWFVKMEELAKPAIEAVKNGDIKFIPKRFEKIYLNWMENIEDWCISRQLWWGHRIPAYYCKECGKITVSKEHITICECGGEVVQDEDTLDTWFSSALWPFSILGWPDNTEDYSYFYPNSVLVTGYDIITFWVSKMIFSGLHYTNKIPFENVYIHGLVRDSQGRKMSKSLGNGVDPIEVIENYGTDALRFSLTQNISAGNDMRYMPEKLETARNFANKLWNAAKFVNMYIDDIAVENVENFLPADKWILTKLSKLEKEVKDNLDKYELGVPLQKLYDFIWSDFCDWYIEIVKTRLYDKETNPFSYSVAVWTLNHVLVQVIKMLHPYMPFITEEIYQNLHTDKNSIMKDMYPCDNYNFEKETEIIELFLNMIRNIRNERLNSGINGSKKVNAQVYLKNENDKKLFKLCEDYIKRLGYIENIEYIDTEEKANNNYTSITLPRISIYLDLLGAVDLDKENERLNNEKEKVLKELNRAKSMLSNEKFVSKAPANLVEQEKMKVIKYEEMLNDIEKRIKELNSK
ncbi:valine--tRNA ligase [Clostridium sp. CAG:465]|nr:valine--tRNA ligase [Clostridium sp. CAG:465]